MQQTWTQSEKLKKLNLKMCSAHGKLFSAKEGGQCKKCTESIPKKVCKRGHSRNADVKRCARCDKDRRGAKKAAAAETERTRNAEAAAERAAHRAGLGLYRQGEAPRGD
jgi:hypothetical protein